MIQRLITLLLFFSCAVGPTFSQVKIGDNTTTINPNSLLEMESTNKGFLPPRIALNDLNSSSPMTATVAEGTLIYSDGGTVTDGYYFWSGVKWINLTTSKSERDNFVLVKSVSDFPAPVGGVITLVAGKLYEINGTITLSSKINLNGCSLQGDDSGNDKLVYTGTEELFTGNKTGNISYLSFSTPAGKVFNLDGGGTNQNLIVQNCFFLGCNSIGTVANVGGTVYLTTLAFFYNTNGITFQNDNNVVLHNTLWDISNQNVYEKFIGTFNVIQILGGDRLVSSANSATAEHISGITSLVAGSIKVVMFVGSGTYISGTATNAWEIEASGVDTQKDDVAAGNIYVTTPAQTTIATAGVAVKVAGTTTSVGTFRTTSTTNNRLAYTGSKSRTFHVVGSLTAVTASSNKYFSFYIAKNGTILPESRQQIKLINTSDQASVTLSCALTMAPNDYIEVWVVNETSGTNMTVQTMNLSIK